MSAAYRLRELSDRQPLAVTLFEAGPQAGGLIATIREGDYLVECGADSFITNKPWAVRLCERLGIAGELLPTDARYRQSLVLRDGKPLPAPAGFQLLAPASVTAFLRSPILSWKGKLRALRELWIPPRAETGDETLESFAVRRFGREALERLIQPMVGGIYTADPAKLSLQATLPRFLEMERQHGSVIRALRQQQGGGEDARSTSGARYGLFAAPRQGMSQLLQTLQEQVQARFPIHFNTRIRQLQPQRDGGWTVETGTGINEPFDAVILAIPLHQAAALLRPSRSALADALNEIEYASSAIVVSGHALKDIRHPLEAFGLVIPHCEGRRILAVSCASRKFPDRAPEGKIILRTFVGGAMQPEMLQLSDAEILQAVQEELRDIFGVGGEPDFLRIARYPDAMPQYHLGHLDRVSRIERLTREIPGLQLAGNALHGVGIPDAIHSGEQAAERTTQGLAEIKTGH